MLKKILLIAIVFVGTFVLLPAPAQAALFESAKEQACEGSQLGASAPDCSGASTEIDSLIASIINLLSIVVGIIAVIMIIVSGLRFITSGGDSNSVSSARNGILYALVGIVLVVLAQVIVRFIINRAS